MEFKSDQVTTNSMDSSLDAIEFLARSSSRVRVLDSLNEEGPHTRDELKGVTEVSRTTLSRMLADFEERGWIERADHRYHATPKGEFLATEITRLIENVTAAEELDAALHWLPHDGFEFDLRRLRDAELVEVSWNDPASMRAIAEGLSDASRIRSVATTLSREVVEVVHDITVDGEAEYDGVLTDQALEIARGHPDVQGKLREIVDSGQGDIYRYGGSIDLAMVLRVDSEAMVCSHGWGGPELQALRSDDVAFRRWVDSYIDELQADSGLLTVESFAT